MSRATIPDPVATGVAAGWKALDGAMQPDLELSADVVIIGSGAGGGMAAEQLAAAGLDVLLLEEGAVQLTGFPPAGGQGLSRVVSGVGQPQDR